MAIDGLLEGLIDGAVTASIKRNQPQDFKLNGCPIDINGERDELKYVTWRVIKGK